MNNDEKESLRKDLIEDVKKYFNEWCSRHYTIVGYGVEEIINRRFRVKK